MADAAALRRDIRVAKRLADPHAQSASRTKAQLATEPDSSTRESLRIRRTKTAPVGAGGTSLSTLKRDVLQHRAAAAGHPANVTRSTHPRSVPIPPHKTPQLQQAPPVETAAVGASGTAPPLAQLVPPLLQAALVLQLKRNHMPELVAAAAAGADIRTPLPAKASKRGAQRPKRAAGPGAKALPAGGAPRVLVIGLRECAREVRLGHAKAVFTPLASWSPPPVLLALQQLHAACRAAGVPFVQAGSKRAFSKALALKGRATAAALLSTQALQGLPYQVLDAWKAGPQDDAIGLPPSAESGPQDDAIGLPPPPDGDGQQQAGGHVSAGAAAGDT